MLSATHAEELRESWQLLGEERQEAASQFLQRLVADVPALQASLGGDPERSIRRIVTLMDYIVDHAEDGEALLRTLRGLGHRYLDASVGRREIHAAGLAWMWTLERRLGPELTPPRLVAWSQVLAFILRALRESAPAFAG
ncbi:MAG: hypothetical protein U0P81_08965 [Holophagaceae bacterium]